MFCRTTLWSRSSVEEGFVGEGSEKVLENYSILYAPHNQTVYLP